jgi:hypothetical protein
MLAGAAAGLTAAAGITSTEAKKKKRKKPKKGSSACPAGTLLATVIVPGHGQTVFTPSLDSGQRHRLRAVGACSTDATHGNDAFAAFPYANPTTFEKTADGVRLGLSIDGGSPDQWGTYKPDHIYEREVTGQGDALALKFIDPNTDFNAGALIVDVFCS